LNDTLKAAGRIGTELGAAKAENEKLRGLLQQVVDCQAEHYGDGCGLHLSMITLVGRIKDALSQQAEPTDTFTAVDMATAAAQGFRDGQKAEPAPAQDERELVVQALMACDWSNTPIGNKAILQRAVELLSRPAQTEQQPPYPHEAMDVIATSRYQVVASGSGPLSRYYVRAGDGKCELYRGGKSDCEHVARKLAGAFLDGGLTAFGLYAAPIAQTAPQHFDDRAIDRFAAAMKTKMAAARAKGRDGWFDRIKCPEKRLARMLVEHLSKGNDGTFEDVANFCMMLHQRGEDPQALAEAAEAPIKKARGEALELGVRALESRAAPQGLRIVFDGPPGPEAGRFVEVEDTEGRSVNAGEWRERTDGLWELSLHATPHPEQSGKFAMHQRVRKTSGSEWQGRICGTYSTPLTPEGYAVESEAHAGSVQIYPAKALEAVE